MRHGRRLAGALALLVSLGIAATPALAAAPVVVQRNATVHREIPAFMSCGNVSLDYVLDATRTITETYDADGTLLRWDLYAHYFATLTDPVSGLVIRDDGARRVTDDYLAETTTGMGGVHHLTWPGHGMVFGVAGREVIDWSGTPPDVNEDDDVRVFQAGLADSQSLICSIFE